MWTVCYRWLTKAAALVLLAANVSLGSELIVSPIEVTLTRPESSQQLLISAREPDGRLRDVTREAAIEAVPAGSVAVDSNGLVRPIADGPTELIVTYREMTAKLAVKIRGQQSPAPVSFSYDIIPILTKSRCNSGGCHGKAEGQNGFKLSVFGFDPEADHQAIAAEGRGRRIALTAPASSLLLRKGSAAIPHGGGLKLEADSERYRLLCRWIAEGAPFRAAGESAVVAIEVEPREQILLSGERQQLQVTAIAADGTRRCVTVDAEFESNATAIADVDQRGLITATDVPGEAAVLARYLGHVAICRITLPHPSSSFARPPENNFIDGLVWNKLQRLGIQPSELADDATFLRRAYLDVIGTLPTSDEVRTFLRSSDPQKRQRVIQELFERPEYVDYWTMRWANLLRVDPATITPQGAVGMTRWLRQQLSANRPYDVMMRDLLTAQGSTLAESPAAFYKALDNPEKMARSVSQLLLGVRIECAQCHHHPAEKWGQEDYFALAGFFTGVTRKKLPTGGEAIISRGGADLKHPRTGEVVAARPLGGPPADFTGMTDRRRVLADWMTAAENPYFARMIVNRLFSHYMGRGLVEPIDDLRATNPASNEPLLDALVEHLRAVRFDLKTFSRTLLESRVYQLASETNDANRDDHQNFSHATDKALPAEVLLDMISHSVGVPEKFNGWPLGYRSIELWDSRVPHYFFRLFGRPVRASVCECERSEEPSIAQALHLLNSPELADKLHDRRGTCYRLVTSSRTDDEIIDELYLMTLSRGPSIDEKKQMLAAMKSASDRREATEDILWSLLNHKAFLYNH